MSKSPVIQLIENEIQNNKVVIFMKGTPEAPQCGFSAAACQLLRSYSYPFKGVDVIANPEIRAELPEYSEWPTFPQIFIGGKLVGGCDILHELNDSGELKQLLEEAFKK